MKKMLLACLAFFAIFLSMAHSCEAYDLPEMASWRGGELRSTVLDTVSGNRGLWQERDDITDGGTHIHAVWLEGAGEKGWTPPAEPVSSDDGLMGRGAWYRTMTVAGEKALIEHHPITGFSIAVKIEGRGTLTVESRYAKEEEICSAAIRLVEMMR